MGMSGMSDPPTGSNLSRGSCSSACCSLFVSLKSRAGIITREVSNILSCDCEGVFDNDVISRDHGSDIGSMFVPGSSDSTEMLFSSSDKDVLFSSRDSSRRVEGARGLDEEENKRDKDMG